MNLSKYRRSLDGTDVVLGARRIRGPPAHPWDPFKLPSPMNTPPWSGLGQLFGPVSRLGPRVYVDSARLCSTVS